MQSYIKKLYIGFSYGVSFPLTLVILDYWLKDIGVSNSVIGLFTLLHTTFLFKFVWGTFIENYDIPYLSRLFGRAKSWIIISHAVLMFGLVLMAFSSPETHLVTLMLGASLVAAADGCRNIVLYPYQIQNSSCENIGYIANAVSLGHRIGTIIIKVMVLQIAHFWNWTYAYLSAAILVFILMFTVLRLDIPTVQQHHVKSIKEAAYKSIVLPFQKLITDHKEIFAILILYKFPDFMIQKMSRPFLIEIGFSKLVIANIVQLFGSISVIVGSFMGAYIIAKIGLIRTMMYVGILHMCSFFLYLLLIKYGTDPRILTCLIFYEGITGGCVTASFLAFIYSTCKTVSQYATLWACHEAGGLIFMSVSGCIVDAIGWTLFFVITPFLFLPAAYVLKRSSL